MEWKISKEPVGYEEAITSMETRVQAIRNGVQDELVWLLEHPPLYTAGTSARDTDLLDHKGFPVYKTGRGGQYTYHGPGQRIAYVMLDLKKRTPDVRQFVKNLSQSVILTLAEFGIRGETRDDRVGVWVSEGKVSGKYPETRESKIAALGIRIRQWVTYHGVAVNINPDLGHYSGIVPCGIREHGVTSLDRLGIATTMEEFDKKFIKSFCRIF